MPSWTGSSTTPVGRRAGFATSTDVYLDHLTWITMPAWSHGRVAVLRDAAWCVTPLGGGGTSLAMVGGYVSAALLSQDPGTALHRYEQWMRPLIESAQKLPSGTPRLFYPQSASGVPALRLAARVGSSRPLRRLTSRIGHVARTGQALPEIRIGRSA